MKTKFYSIKTCCLLAFLAMGVGQTAKAQTITKEVRNSTTGGDGTTAWTNDEIRYTVIVKCGPQESLSNATITDLIPAGTAYIPGTTTLNGALVPDVNGVMPYTTGGQINSPGSPAGVCASNTTTTVIFRVKVVANAGQITNIATVTGSNFNALTNQTATNINANSVCNILYEVIGTSIFPNRIVYREIREVDVTTGSAFSTKYNGPSGACRDINGNVLPTGSLFTGVSAIAFEQSRGRLYFVNDDITTAQSLGYVDLFSSPLTAVTFNVPLLSVTGAGYNITRMAAGRNGVFYALTENNQYFISFTVDVNNQVAVSAPGGLIDDASNGPNSVLSETGGDIICDGAGKVYLITGTNKVYSIDPLTRIATYMATITGITITDTYRTYSAAINNNGTVYIGGRYPGLFEVSFSNFVATQVGNGGGTISSDFATCGFPVRPLRVAVNEKPTVNNTDVNRTSEVYAKVQPNPFKSELNLQVQLNTTEQVRVQLIDFFGRTVYTSSEKMSAGVNSLQLSVPANLGAGIYVVELWTGNKRLLQKKIMKQ